MNKIKTLVSTLVLAAIVTGCASFTRDAHKTIYATAIMADAGMQTYASYWKDQVVAKGQTPELLQQKTNMMNISFKVGTSLNVADRALATYEGKVGTNTTTQAIVTALIQTAIQDAGNFVGEIGIITGKPLLH